MHCIFFAQCFASKMQSKCTQKRECKNWKDIKSKGLCFAPALHGALYRQYTETLCCAYPLCFAPSVLWTKVHLQRTKSLVRLCTMHLHNAPLHSGCKVGATDKVINEVNGDAKTKTLVHAKKKHSTLF